MNSEKLRDWLEIVGIFSVVASLVFVGLQMRQDQTLAEAQQYIDKAASHVEMSGLIAAHQPVWIKGLDREDLTREDQAKFDQIARSWHVRKLNNYYASLRVSTAESDAIVRSFAIDLYKHPGLRSWFQKFMEDSVPRQVPSPERSREATFETNVERVLGELDQEKPKFPDQKTYFLP